MYYIALDKGETALAEVAKRKVEQIETESLGMYSGSNLLRVPKPIVWI
jgi:hypothetical protein